MTQLHLLELGDNLISTSNSVPTFDHRSFSSTLRVGGAAPTISPLSIASALYNRRRGPLGDPRLSTTIRFANIVTTT